MYDASLISKYDISYKRDVNEISFKGVHYFIKNKIENGIAYAAKQTHSTMMGIGLYIVGRHAKKAKLSLYKISKTKYIYEIHLHLEDIYDFDIKGEYTKEGVHLKNEAVRNKYADFADKIAHGLAAIDGVGSFKPKAFNTIGIANYKKELHCLNAEEYVEVF